MIFRFLVFFIILFFQIVPSAFGSKPKGRIDLEQKKGLGKRIPLELDFLDSNGKKIILKDIVNKPTILNLVYFTCPGICTPLLNDLQHRLESLSIVPGKDFQIITVSFDAKEGPSLAKKKKKAYLKRFKRNFPKNAWFFLTGKKKNIEKLATSVGFFFRREGKLFRHPGGILILSPTGKICRYIYGIEYLPADLQMGLLKAKKEVVEVAIPKPMIANKTRMFCFIADDEGRIVGLNIIKAGMAFIFLSVTGFAIFLIFSTIKKAKETDASEKNE